MKAVILAGGRGKRFGQLTEKRPKSLICVSGKPLIIRLLDVLPKQIDSCIIVIGYLGQSIRDYLGEKYGRLTLSYMWQDCTGTAGALVSALPALLGEKFFLVVGSDDVFAYGELEKLILCQPTYGVHRGIRDNISHFGVRVEDGYFEGFNDGPLEKQGDRYVGVGAYCLSQNFFEQKMFVLGNGELSIPHTLSQASFKTKVVIIDGWLPVNNEWEKDSAEKEISNPFLEYVL